MWIILRLGVKYAETTRYYDGCKPTCSWPENIGNPNPWVLTKSCDIGGFKEIPLLFLDPRSQTSSDPGIYYNRTPSAWDDKDQDAISWFNSKTYQDWVQANPSAKGSLAYTCFDMTPYAVNDTLAYAFVATSMPDCGKCYRLQFVSDSWRFGNPRVTHRALKGKTLIVMATNTGAQGGSKEDADGFDIMIPGGGFCMYDCLSEQLGLPPKSGLIDETIFGAVSGGLLAECIFPVGEDWQKYGNRPSDRFDLDTWQRCLRDKCHKAFDSRSKQLLDGCLWHADWFMAADNPEAYYSEVSCPKYLVDKYKSTVTTKLPDCYTSSPRTCQMDGMPSN